MRGIIVCLLSCLAIAAHGESLDYSRLLSVAVDWKSEPKTLDDLFTVEIRIKNVSSQPIKLYSSLGGDMQLFAFEFDQIPKGWVHRYAEGFPVTKHSHYGIKAVEPGQGATCRVDLRVQFSTIDLYTPTIHIRGRVGGIDDSVDPNGTPLVWGKELTLRVREIRGTTVKM